jgi:hypothetical protein
MEKRILKLKKVTLSNLDETALDKVEGGGGVTIFNTCDGYGYQCGTWPSACGTFCQSGCNTQCGPNQCV